MILKKIFLFLIVSFVFCILPSALLSQELNCTVQVLSPALQSSADKQVLQTLQQAIYEFINTRKWTNDIFSQDERIECSFVITVTERPAPDQFKASVQVQSRRPIFKTSYNSLLFNTNDKIFAFTYTPSQPFEYTDNTYTSNLTSLIAFYAYYVIGLDYDSYSLEGGTPYFQKAQQVVTNAQAAGGAEWDSKDTRSRYWLVENILNSTFKPLRECIYKYHRLGFDVMAEDLNGGRTAVMQSLDLAKTVFDSKPGSFNMQVFFLAKADELVNLFSQLEQPADKQKMVDLLNQIDPANTTKYNKILQSGNQ